jgi:hypothetical protein
MIASLQRSMTDDLLAGHYLLAHFVDLGVIFVLVWLLWYAVGTETRGRGLSVLTPKTGIRRTADVLAICFGASLLPYVDRIVPGGAYWMLFSVAHLLWIATIIGFYSHDLWASFRTRRLPPDVNRPVNRGTFTGFL